jgi:hypothetical protein
LQTLQARLDQLKSPYNESFSEYLKEALRMELIRAQRFDANADVRIGGELRKNDLTVGFDLGTLDIEARFLVYRRGTVVYDRVKSIRHQWDSTFMAAIAIPLARDAYPGAVQRLLDALFSDTDFVAAIH